MGPGRSVPVGRRLRALCVVGRFLPLIAGIACASGSASGPPSPAHPVIPELPAALAESSVPTSPEAGEWWRAFDDPVLDRVVGSVLASNFSVAEAVARLEQARTRARLADAAVLPSVSARAGVDAFDQPTNAAIGAQLEELGLDFPLPDRLGFPTYSLGAEFAYEVDFWGRVRHTALAAGSELIASEFDLAAARLGILAETIAAYFDIAHQQRQLSLSRRQVEVATDRERFVADRYQRGLAPSGDLHRVRQALRETEASLPQLRNQLTAAESRLAVLLGGGRDELGALLPDPFAPAPPGEGAPPGVPADLLLQRPDVLAAGHRLEAAGHTVEARRAALLPQLSLAGSIGLQSTEVSGLFDVQQWFANLAANLLRPVFDGGRLEGGLELAEARFDELAASYGRTVVTAAGEVEAALAALDNESRRRESLAAHREEARASLDFWSERYTSGIGGYGDVLDASQLLLAVESSLAGSDRDLALARLTLHRALGGSWAAGDDLAPAADAAVGAAGNGAGIR